MSIDEAINIAKSDIKYNKQIGCDTSYEEQLADWLEELKAYREIGTVEECRNSVLGIERAYNKGYADGSLSVTEEISGKAIDDFVNACKEDILCQTFGLHINGIERIAEQLKVGEENE